MISRTIAKKVKILGILWVFPMVLGSCKRDTRTNAEQYLDQIKECRENKDFHSQLYIFPESLNGEIIKYFYMEESDLFTGSYFYYLALQYDEETFNNELTRLSQVKSDFPKFNKVKPVIHFEEQSLYLTISRDNRYEYALYDKEKLEIAFISNQLFTWDQAKVLLEHTMPSVVIPKELDDGNNTYNMYYYYGGEVGWEVTD